MSGGCRTVWLIKRLPLPSNIRVYELARELGLTNKECLDLCESLGIGVKSHSSSVVEAQADRVRRKAERDGSGARATARRAEEGDEEEGREQEGCGQARHRG